MTTRTKTIIIDFSESTMKKRVLGIKIGTILTVVLSLCFAVLFWLFVKYSLSDTAQALSIIGFDLSRLI